MIMNKEELFIAWFFKGGFFKKLKAEVNKELYLPPDRQHFIHYFFGSEVKLARDFLAGFYVIKNKTESISQRNFRLLQLPSVAIIKEMIIGDFSQVASYNPTLSMLGIASSVHQPATIRAVKNFLHEQYENFRKSDACNGYVSSLQVIVFPYCDKGIIDCTEKFFYGDLDHKQDKAGTHFYLALNIHNLTPCCKVCNHHKGVQAVSFDPATHALDHLFKFTLDTNVVLELQKKFVPGTFKIAIKEKKSKVTESSPDMYAELNRVLYLEDRYRNMQSAATYLYQLKRVANPQWISTVNSIVGTRYTSDSAKKFILGDFSWNGSVKIQPLTKLLRDLADEIKLFTPQPLVNKTKR